MVLKVAQMDRAGGLPHGMNGQIPPSAGPEEVDPQLRRIWTGSLPSFRPFAAVWDSRICPWSPSSSTGA